MMVWLIAGLVVLSIIGLVGLWADMRRPDWNRREH